MLIKSIEYVLFLLFSIPVQLHVFTYDENKFTEEKYRKVEEIPSVPLASETAITCKKNKYIF
jgi:hypothetical protein